MTHSTPQPDMPQVRSIYYIGNPSEMDVLNVKALKAELYDGLVRMVRATPETTRDQIVLAFGVEGEPWTETTFVHVEAGHHVSLRRGLTMILQGDTVWEELLEAVELLREEW